MPRMTRARSSSTCGSAVGPSMPQLRLSFQSAPSRLRSPFTRLCFRSYDTRSCSVNPSWHAMKLTLDCGARGGGKRSLDPLRRVARSFTPPTPRQKRRTVSRNRPFHSAKRCGNRTLLVAVRPEIPRFRDELGAAENRVRRNFVEKRRAGIERRLDHAPVPAPGRSGSRQRASHSPRTAGCRGRAGARSGDARRVYCRSR